MAAQENVDRADTALSHRYPKQALLQVYFQRPAYITNEVGRRDGKKAPRDDDRQFPAKHERTESRDASPGTHLEHRTSEDATPPPDLPAG